MTPTPPVAPTNNELLKDGGGELNVTATVAFNNYELRPEHRKLVEAAVTQRQMKMDPSLTAASPLVGQLMSGNDPQSPEFSVLSPIANAIVRDPRPTLQWQPVRDALSYDLTVTDKDYIKVAAQTGLTEPQWRIASPLKQGGEYVWSVTAHLRDGSKMIAPAHDTAIARFRVLTSAREQELRQAEQEYAGKHLVLGLLYARAGLRDETLREFKALAKANPGSPIARSLLRQAQAKRAAP
jgi:hypothetical protein